MKTQQRLATLLALAALATGSAAQSVHALRAQRWELEVGQRLELDFGVWREGAELPAPWPERFTWFFVRAGGEQLNLDDPRVAGARRSLELTAERAGIHLIAADRPSFIERVPKGDFRVFLAGSLGRSTLNAADLRSVTDHEGGALRVRRVESTKALVRVLGKEGFLPNSAVAQSKAGQTVEIRPLADPATVPVRSDLPLRIYVPNPKKAGTKVMARHLATGRTQSFLTDRYGTGFFTITLAGLWRVEAHHARPAADAEADWEVFSATLTFDVPAGDPRQGGGK